MLNNDRENIASGETGPSLPLKGFDLPESSRAPVLLVNPWIHDFTAFDLWMKPLGLLYLAAILERVKYRVRFLDCVDPEAGPRTTRLGQYNCHTIRSEEIAKPGVFAEVPRRFKRYGISPSRFRSLLKDEPEPGLIAVTSMMTYWYSGVAETIRVLRERFPRTPIVLGGIYATLCTDHARGATGADLVLPGRGEKSLLLLADHIYGRGNESRPYSPKLDDLPWPAYHLYGRPKSVCLLTSLGCPYRCTYCASHRLFPKFELRRPGLVVEEIQHTVNDFGAEDITFYDDALLLASRGHLEKILDGVTARGIRARFHTPNGLHAEMISPDLGRKMFRAGFKTVRLGFESSDLDRQRDSDHKVTNAGLRRALRGLYEAGFTPGEVMVYVLIGLPGQSAKEVIESIRYVHECGGRVSLSQYSPIPGTADFQKAVARGFPPGEPLLANKSIYAMRSMDLSFEEYEQIRRISKEGNALLGPAASAVPG